MTQAPAGWYPQPDGTQRYWDGSAWTEHTAPGLAAAAPVVPTPAPPAPVAVAPVPVPPAPVSATPVLAPPAAYAAGPGSYPAAQAAPGAAKKNRLPMILGIVGGVVLLGIVATILLVTVVFKAASGPKDTVNDFVTAANSNDCDGLIVLLSERYKNDNYFDSCEGYDASEAAKISYEIDGVSISGDTATVTGMLTDAEIDEIYAFDFELVKEDGAWKIDEIVPG